MIQVKKLHEDAQLPNASHPGTCLGYDIYAAEDAIVHYGIVTTVKTGIAIQIKAPMSIGFLLRERSGMAKQGIKLLGGILDADYVGEIMVMLTNLNQDSKYYQIKKGDRIAQAIPLPTMTKLPVEWVESLEKTERGESGFGSTGR